MDVINCWMRRDVAGKRCEIRAKKETVIMCRYGFFERTQKSSSSRSDNLKA